MKNRVSQVRASYGPQEHKTFTGALGAFFEQECPQLGGERTRRVLVQAITDMVADFFPETSHLRQGQIQWVTVNRDEKASYGKRIQDTKLQSVVLNLVRTEDFSERAEGKKLRDMKKDAVARMFTESYEQGGCMTNAEMAILLKVSDSTVSTYAREWECENEKLLPRRGTIHDMGPSITHKKIIIEKLFLERKSVGQVMRETHHSAQAVHRYIVAFKQTLLARRKGLSVEETAFACRMSQRLVREYNELIDKLADGSSGLQTLLDRTIGELLKEGGRS